MKVFSVLALCAAAATATADDSSDSIAAIPRQPPTQPSVVVAENGGAPAQAGDAVLRLGGDVAPPSQGRDDVGSSVQPDIDLVQALMSELQAMRAERAEMANLLKQAQAQIAGTDTEVQEQEKQEEKERRRRLASEAYSGLQIKRDNAMISLGANSDVMIARSGVGELGIVANVTVAGNLDALSLSIDGVDISGQQDQIDMLVDTVDGKANQSSLESLIDTVENIGGDSWDNQERAGLAMSLCMGAVGSGASNFLSIITVPYDNDAINSWCQSSINSGWKACGVVKDHYHGQNCHGTFGGSLSTSDIEAGSYAWGGYMTFIPKSTVEAGSWNSGACDHDSTWVCCSPQC